MNNISFEVIRIVANTTTAKTCSSNLVGQIIVQIIVQIIETIFDSTNYDLLAAKQWQNVSICDMLMFY